MRFLPAALLAAVLAACASPASAEPGAALAAAFGNTVKAFYPDGKAQRIWFRPDGTWEAVGRRGKWSSGKWSIKGEKVCLKQSRPFPAPFKYCTELPPSNRVGVVWTSRDMHGEPIRLTVVKGIERP